MGLLMKWGRLLLSFLPVKASAHDFREVAKPRPTHTGFFLTGLPAQCNATQVAGACG